MRIPRSDWLETFGALGEALFEVLAAEWRLLGEDWQRSLRALEVALGLFALALACGLIWVALVIYAAVLFVALWLPLWQAAMVVATAVLLVILTAAGAGYQILKRNFENPAVAARRRFDDHLGWWHDRLLRQERSLAKGDDDGQAETAERSAGKAPPKTSDG